MSTWVFLRGLTRESRHWGAFPDVFRHEVPDAQIVTPDLPGNGTLNTHESPVRVEEMVERLRVQLIGQGVPPPYELLAMSLGAMVAVAWAARYPEEVLGCVLINTSLRPFSPFYRRLKPRNYVRLLKLALFGGSDDDWERTILRLTSRRTACPDKVVKKWIAYRRESPVSSRNAFRQLLAAARYQAPLARPNVPILVLCSVQDALVDSSCSRQLALRWRSGFATHPTAGHDLPLDDGPWVARQVSRWLEGEGTDTET